MEKQEIIKSISTKGNGEIYLGVVGAVRTGKSTFIKRFMENLVVPNIGDEYYKKKCLDEIPQTSGGSAIMTTEPKFIPSNETIIKVDEFETKIKLVDCVGYVVDGASGYLDNDGNPRMVKTPWFSDAIPFTEAAYIGTEKVIKDHATIGVVVTTDGSFGEIKRESYESVEKQIVEELKSIGKPFVVVLNTVHPTNTKTIEICDELRTNYGVPVIPKSVETMNEVDIMEILRTTLNEFPIMDIKYNIPKWICALNSSNEIKKSFIDMIKCSSKEVNKLKDVDDILNHFKDSEYISKSYISELDASNGVVTVSLEENDDLYDKVLKDLVGEEEISKSRMIQIFENYKNNKDELDSIKEALRMARNSGYGIVYPDIKDMKLDTPEIIKQGSRYGVKLKATASSIHMMKVDVTSTFEPIIGSEEQSKELVNYLMKDYELDKNNIWKSEIFGRSLENIVKEGIQVKLASMPDQTRNKLSNTVTKIVNKGSNNLIAIVL